MRLPRLATGEIEPIVITPYSACCIGEELTCDALSAASHAWNLASLAVFYPFTNTTQLSLGGLIWVNGATLSGSVDGGVFDLLGNKQATIGSTLQAGVSTYQKGAFSSPLLLPPGDWMLGFACDNVIATFISAAPTNAIIRCFGVQRMASGFPLPATATFAVSAVGDLIAAIGLYDSALTWL